MGHVSSRIHKEYWEKRLACGDKLPTSSFVTICKVCGKDFEVYRHNHTSWRKIACCSPECLAIALHRESFCRGRNTTGIGESGSFNARCSQCGSVSALNMQTLCQRSPVCASCGHKG
jgi:hypothetical protein